MTQNAHSKKMILSKKLKRMKFEHQIINWLGQGGCGESVFLYNCYALIIIDDVDIINKKR